MIAHGLVDEIRARGGAGWFGAAACTVTLEQLIMLQLGIIIVCFSLTQHMNNVGWQLHMYSSFLPLPAYSLLVHEGDALFFFPCAENGPTEQQSQMAAHQSSSASLPSEEEARSIESVSGGDKEMRIKDVSV